MPRGSVRDFTPWADAALSPEGHAALAEVRPLTASRFMGGSSPNGPWTYRAYIPDFVPTSPFRVKQLVIEGRDADDVARRAAAAVREASRNA